MPAARPVTDQDREQIKQLHAEGLGCNQIADRLNRSASTIGRLARELGLPFDRSRVIAATRAAVADARARRADLALVLLDDATRLRAQIWEPHEYIDHGGRDFTEARWTQHEPSPQDKRNLMLAAATAIDRVLKLDLHDRGDDGGADVDAWLDNMTGQ